MLGNTNRSGGKKSAKRGNPNPYLLMNACGTGIAGVVGGASWIKHCPHCSTVTRLYPNSRTLLGRYCIPIITVESTDKPLPFIHIQLDRTDK